MAAARPAWSVKSAWAMPLRLSMSTVRTGPNVESAVCKRGSVIPWEGLACFRKTRSLWAGVLDVVDGALGGLFEAAGAGGAGWIGGSVGVVVGFLRIVG